MALASRLLIASLLVSSTASATPQDPAFTETDYFRFAGFLAVTGIAWAPDDTNRLFMINKAGNVFILQDGLMQIQPFAVMAPIFTSSECGLIGMTFDHDFASNGYVYFFVTVSASEQQIIRYTAVGNTGTDRTVLVTGLDTVGANHDGGGIGIGPDGKLYWAIGDNGSARGVNADLTRSASKIGRANLDGTPVLDNPFFDGAGPNNDYIWARGFRNPFTLTFQKRTGELWVDTVGTSYEQIFRPRAGDHAGWNAFEINQPAGFLRPAIWYSTNGSRSRTIAATGAVRSSNVVTFTNTGTDHYFHLGQRVTIAGVTDASFNNTLAVVTSTPTPSTFTIAQVGPDAISGNGTAATENIGGSITGGTFWESSAVPAAYRGDYFFGDYNSGRIERAQLDANNDVISIDGFGTGYQQSIDIDVGPDGNLYHVQIDGRVRRFQPVTPSDLVVTPLAQWVSEGGQAHFHVRLGAAPAGNVTVSVARVSGDADLTVTAGAALVFTPANFATPQMVTLAAAADLDSSNDTAQIAVTSNGLASEQVDVTIIDDDLANLVVSTTALTIGEGTTGSFDVRLSTAPIAPVTVTVARESGDTDVVAANTFVFTAADYATPRAVTVSAVQDADGATDLATIAVTAGGYQTRRVAVTVTDDEQVAPIITSTAVTTAVIGAPYRYDVESTGLGVTYSLGTMPGGMSIDPSTGLISWTPAALGNANVQVIAANGVPPDATQTFQIAVVADAPPTVRLTRPVMGEVVSGRNAEFYGDGIDDVGTVGATFTIDGMLAYTDLTPGDHYHFGGTHNLWDTSGLTDGPHVVRLRVVDTIGQPGFAEVMITVQNGQSDAGVIAADAAMANDDAAATPNDDAAATPNDDAAPTVNDDAAPTVNDDAMAVVRPDAAAARDAGTAAAADAGAIEEASSCDCRSTGPSGAPTWLLVLAACAFVRSKKKRYR